MVIAREHKKFKTVDMIVEQLQKLSKQGYGEAIMCFQADSITTELVGAGGISYEDKKGLGRVYLILYGNGEEVFNPHPEPKRYMTKKRQNGGKKTS